MVECRVYVVPLAPAVVLDEVVGLRCCRRQKGQFYPCVGTRSGRSREQQALHTGLLEIQHRPLVPAVSKGGWERPDLQGDALDQWLQANRGVIYLSFSPCAASSPYELQP